MIENFLAAAFASIRKSPFTTVANILTLALGLTCFIAAWGIATYWRSADGYHHNAARTFVIGQSNTIKGQPRVPLQAISSWTMPRYLKEDFPEIERYARAVQTPETAVAAGPNKVLLNQGTVDPDFLSIFDLDFVAGDRSVALNSPDGAVLTEGAASRLFGSTPALGQHILVNGSRDLTVTGVIRSPRQPSFMGEEQDAVYRFDFLRSWAGNKTTTDLDAFDSWMGLMPFTFVVLKPGASVDAINARLPAFLQRRVPEQQKKAADTVVRLFPLAGLTTFDLDRKLFASSAVQTSAVAALLALAALTLLVACVNYANLTTAQAASRTKEVGMRRVLGAGGLQVMAQCWLEAMVLTGIAAVVAIAVLLLAAPVVRVSTSIDILYFLKNGLAGLGMLAGLIVLVAMIAGAYPAMILSRVRPAAALRSGRSRSGSKLVVRVLVAVQFASAGFLLILVTVTQLQRAHLERAILGSLQEPVVVLNDLMRIGVDYETLQTRLSGQPGIAVTSVADIPPWSPYYNGMGFARSPEPSAANSMALVKSVGYDYFTAFDLKLLAGRQFDRQHDVGPTSLYGGGTGSTPRVILDRQLAKNLGFKTPQAALGQTVWIPASVMMGGGGARPVEVVGVTEGEPVALESISGRGVIYTYAERAMWGEQRPIVRLHRDRVAEGVASITRVFAEIAPNIPPEIRFYDQEFERKYRQYARLSQVFVLLASAAFVISSIGLVGIAVHSAARRRHEVAVRKTLGSSVTRIVRLLLTDFSLPVLIGNLMAWPLAWLAADTYLRAFADRIELSAAPFIISAAATLAIAWAAVIGVVLRAATLRPAEVLRYS